MNEERHIYPIDDQLVQRAEREARQGHRAHVYWMTGLSGSGKSTIAKATERQLFDQGISVVVLDGDNIRNGINSNLGFSEEDRAENIRRVAELAKLFASFGHLVLVSFISPTQAVRDHARDIVGSEDFSEVYINASFETCAKRDVKGLYAKALAGEIKNFTGLDSPYEAPSTPAVVLNSEEESTDLCVDFFKNQILQTIKV